MIKLFRQIFFYGVIGLTSAGIDSALYYILTRQLGFPIMGTNFFTVNVGITLSFFLNTFFNFKTKDNLKKRAMTFFLVGYAGLALSMSILYVLGVVLKYNDINVKISSILFVAVLQFLLNKFFTFKKNSML